MIKNAHKCRFTQNGSLECVAAVLYRDFQTTDIETGIGKGFLRFGERFQHWLVHLVIIILERVKKFSK